MYNNEFPHPLPTEQQIELLKKLPDTEARTTLLERNLRLVVYITKKFSNTSYATEDFLSIGCIGLSKAIDSFNINKNSSFATYASRCIENEILMYLRSQSKHSKNCSLEEPLSIDIDGNALLLEDIVEDFHSTHGFETIENKEKITIILTNILNYLYKNSFTKFLIYLYSLGGKKQKEIADLLGISRSYVSKLYGKVLNEVVLPQKTIYCLKSNAEEITNIRFFYTEDILYIGISKNLFTEDCSKMFDGENAHYFFKSLPDKKSFSEVADIFRLLD